MKKIVKLLMFIMTSLLFLSTPGFSQEHEEINWLSFEQLEDSISVTPKKVFIYFHADWCAPCLKMDARVFRDPKVIQSLNSNYYAVKMNVESTDTIVFGNQRFINKRARKPNPIHEIPLLMASRKDAPFTLPAIVLSDDNFKATARYFQYLDAEKLLKILTNKN